MTPKIQTVSDRVKEVLTSQLGVSLEDCKDTASLVDDLGCDELDQVEVVMGLEEEFNIEINDETAEKFKTVGDLVAHVEKAQKS